jgi:DNA topoisomerase-1
MGKTLVVVESPGKINKIQSILGSNYVVKASVGHIIDLDEKTMSVDINNNFEPNYQPTKRAGKVIQDLKAVYAKSDDILIATDEDREGEMIAWSLAYVLKLKNPKRIIFNSITKDEISNSVKNPKGIDYNMVNAAKTRRILDRIVGYELSPILWNNIQFGLSAGRVQSVIARLIVDREDEIKEFMDKGAESFFRFKGEFNPPKSFDATMHEKTGNVKGVPLKGDVAKIKTENESRELLEAYMKAEFTVVSVADRQSYRNPSPPFTTSTLQQEASRKLGLSVTNTMRAAQLLYEAGLITYMRTDSVNLSEEAIKNIGDYVTKTYGKEYYNKKIYESKSKNTQEAHEAVRPTDVAITTADDVKFGQSEKRLYELIWKRTVASQMKPAEFNVTTIQISISNNNKYFFQSTIEKLKFDGFLKVYNLKNLEKDDSDDIGDVDGSSTTNIPKVGDKVKPKIIIGKQEFSKPPCRYNEASLVNKLDPKNLNIGRPATYATMINIIQERGYVKKGDVKGVEKSSLTLSWTSGKSDKITEKTTKVMIGNDTNKFIPTALGTMVNNFLVKEFPTIMDYKFTSSMEDSLDNIAEGKQVWHKMLNEFYKMFHPQIEKLKGVKQDKPLRDLGTDPASGCKIIATIGQYGEMVKLVGSSKDDTKYAPIKPPLTMDTITLKKAIQLLKYPKTLGTFEKKPVQLQQGQYGLYIKHKSDNYSVDKDDVTIEEAIKIITEQREKKKGLGQFSTDTNIYTIKDGKFGRYIQTTNKKKPNLKIPNVKIPDSVKTDELTVELIEKIIQTKYKTGSSKSENSTEQNSSAKAVKKPETKPSLKKSTHAPKKTAKKKVITKKVIKAVQAKNINLV